MNPKPKKKSTKKSTKKSLTPNQVKSKATSLMRGLDNEVAKVQKGVAAIQGIRAQLTSLTSGLANAVLPVAKKPAKPVAAKAAKPVKAKPVKKAKAVAKPVKPVKAAKKTKVAAKKSEPKTEKPDQAVTKTPELGRPVLRVVLKDLLKAAGEPVEPAVLRERAVAKHGYWSRQSVYQLLKKDPAFKTVEVDGKSKVTLSDGSDSSSGDDEVNSLVSKVKQDQATSAAV